MKTLDTRDLWKRKNELEDLKDTWETACVELDDARVNSGFEGDSGPLIDAVDEARQQFGEDEEKELNELEELESEISDFRHGETMIAESDFEEYARELAEEIGAIPDDSKWPCTCIDWEKAAEELKQDYTSVSYQGEDWLVRA